MQLKEMIKVILKHIWILVIVLIIFIGGVYYYTKKQPSQFSGSLTLYTMVDPQKESIEYYDYDNYYAFQSSKNLLDTIASWFSDPAYLNTIYAMADEDLPQTTLKNYAKLFETKKNAPSSLVVSIKSSNHSYVNNLLESAKQFSQNNITQWKQIGVLQNVSIVPSDIFIVEEKANTSLNLILGAISGLIISLLIIFGIEYFKKP